MSNAVAAQPAAARRLAQIENEWISSDYQRVSVLSLVDVLTTQAVCM
jgi:hypothetical protein